MLTLNKTLVIIFIFILSSCTDDSGSGGTANNTNTTNTSGNSDETGVVDQRHFVMLFDNTFPEAFDADGYFTETEVVVSVRVVGRNNLRITDGHVINFITERAGYFRGSDDGTGGINRDSCETLDGGCSVTWVVSSRDNIHPDRVVNIVAYTYGEESFKDNNNNNRVDGETVTDALFSGDIYVDSNGNGRLDGVPYIDANLNGVADPIEVNALLTDTYNDINGNGKPDGDIYFDANGNLRHDSGERIFDSNNDGNFFPGEPLVDANGNNLYDAERFIDANNDGVYSNDPDHFTDSNLYPNTAFFDFEATNFRDSAEPYIDLNHNRRFDNGSIDQIIDLDMYGTNSGVGDGRYTVGDGQLNIRSAPCDNPNFCSPNKTVIISDSAYIILGTEED